MTKQQIAINNLCIEINRISPTSLMNMIEIDPITVDQTIIFADWFRKVLCIREFEEDEILYWEEATKGYNNILIANVTPLEMCEKLRKDEFIDIVFFNNDIYTDYIEKIYDTGFISGKGKQDIFKHAKTIEKYWYVKKE